jgi:hypothetical protein
MEVSIGYINEKRKNKWKLSSSLSEIIERNVSVLPIANSLNAESTAYTTALMVDANQPTN